MSRGVRREDALRQGAKERLWHVEVALDVPQRGPLVVAGCSSWRSHALERRPPWPSERGRWTLLEEAMRELTELRSGAAGTLRLAGTSAVAGPILIGLGPPFRRRALRRLPIPAPLMPAIFNWSLDGFERLERRGHFQQPSSSLEAMREMEDMASPIGAFVRDVCVLGPEHEICVDHLYLLWREWCTENGRTKISSKQVFGRDLGAAYPVDTSKPAKRG